MKLVRFASVIIGAMVFAGAMSGCASDGSTELMPSAMVDLNGSDPVKLKAPADGQVNVYDVSIDDLLYSGVIHKGDEVVVDPAAKTVSVNKMVANSKPLYGGDSLKITFDADK